MPATATGRSTSEDGLLQALAVAAPAMLWAGDASGRLVFANRAWLAWRGTTLDQELGHGWLSSVHPEDRTRVAREIDDAWRARRPFTIDYRARSADGQYRPVQHEGTPAGASDAGYVGSCVMVSPDQPITNSHERDALLKTVIEHSSDMVYRMRLLPSAALEYVGGAVEAITGRTADALYQDAALIRKSIHPDDLPVLIDAVESAVPRTTFTLRWLHPDGTIVWAEHRRVPIYDESGRVVAFGGIARDVTGTMEGQRRHQESEDQMRQLAGHLQKAREDERAQVARELHDELGQTLTTLKLEIGRAIAALKTERLSPLVIDRLQSLTGLSDLGLAIVKRIATSLRPPTLDHLGLAEAIRWEALTFKARTGIRCHVRANKTRTALSAEQQTALFRIFQEALTNIVRHAKASAVHVTITEREGQAELRIRDNGKGITDAERDNPRALGLVGMRERAALIGGAFRIGSRRGKGTTVLVHVPLLTVKSRTRRSRATNMEQRAK